MSYDYDSDSEESGDQYDQLLQEPANFNFACCSCMFQIAVPWLTPADRRKYRRATLAMLTEILQRSRNEAPADLWEAIRKARIDDDPMQSAIAVVKKLDEWLEQLRCAQQGEN